MVTKGRSDILDQLDAVTTERDVALARVEVLEAQLEDWKHRAARMALKAKPTLAMDALAKMSGKGGAL